MTAFYDTTVRYYDAEISSRTDDLVLYSELAHEYGGPVFDVGCGTGRVLVHLAQEGVRVHGVDTSRAMLDRLQIKLDAFPHLAEYVTYEQADILTYSDDTRYSLVLLTYNALMHFHEQADQITVLERLRALVADDGLLVIDLPNAGETFATRDTDAILFDRSFIEPDTGNLVMLSAHSYLDRTTQLMRVEWIYDEITEDGTLKRLVAPHVLRYFFMPELQLLLERTGFTVDSVYGSTELEPYEDGSERMIVYARPS